VDKTNFTTNSSNIHLYRAQQAMKLFFKISLIALALFYCQSLWSQTTRMSTAEYIAKYKDAAMQEMRESKVPASITLAQGILESSSGNSRLAKQGNNHFGIKCKKSWTGKTIFENDDALHECFRAYDSALESYRDHSNFLKGNRRYGSLFTLDIYDYKGWAKGLRKAGYATNKKYAGMLIGLIERYSLNKYDSMALNADLTIAETDTQSKENTVVNSPTDQKLNNKWKLYRHKGQGKELVVSAEQELKLDNVSNAGLFHNESFKRKSVYNSLILNESINNNSTQYKNSILIDNNIKVVNHTIKEGETLLTVATIYNVLPDEIRKWNNLPSEHVEIGKELIIKKELSLKKADSEDIEDRNLTIIEELPEEIQSPTLSDSNTHKVQKGESLYSIAKLHNISVSALKTANSLNSNEISPGQELVIPVSKSTQAIEYKVQKRDTLYSIARKHGASVKELKQWNMLESNSIKPGQILLIK
jgi:LysM repeat protein